MEMLSINRPNLVSDANSSVKNNYHGEEINELHGSDFEYYGSEQGMNQMMVLNYSNCGQQAAAIHLQQNYLDTLTSVGETSVLTSYCASRRGSIMSVAATVDSIDVAEDDRRISFLFDDDLDRSNRPCSSEGSSLLIDDDEIDRAYHRSNRRPSINQATKKPRRSNHQFMASRRSSLNYHTNYGWLYHPLSPNQSADFLSMKQLQLLLDLPEENVLHVALYLPLKDVRKLAMTCHSIRDTLIASQGATKSIWMRAMEQSFPKVFRCVDLKNEDAATSTTRVYPSQVTLVDNHHHPLSTIPGLIADSHACSINLPFLTGLMPSRYPKAIDSCTLYYPTRGFGPRSPDFRSYTLAIIDDNVTSLSQEDSLKQIGSTVVPVVQFIGHVGTGSRCIRSDQPFPPNCRKIHNSSSCAGGSSSNHHYFHGHHHYGLGGLSTWVKNHSHRNKAWKNRSDGHHHAAAVEETVSGSYPRTFRTSSSLSGASTSPPSTTSGEHGNSVFVPSTTVVVPSQRSAAAVPNHHHHHHHHSPLFRFLSSLSHLRHHHKSCYSLRPFVVPTVISSSARNDNGRAAGDNDNTVAAEKQNRLLVDVTPRLVAYFEVTIVKQGQGSLSSSSQQDAAATVMSTAEGSVILPLNNSTRAIQRHSLRHECVAIGLSTPSFDPSTKMPGWDAESYGYHGDDGGIFHDGYVNDALQGHGPSFGPGDTVGCGLDYASRKIFFVLNGKFLGYSFDKVDRDVVEKGLYPTVGVDSECPIFVNFGERAFKFDIQRWIANGSGSKDSVPGLQV